MYIMRLMPSAMPAPYPSIMMSAVSAPTVVMAAIASFAALALQRASLDAARQHQSHVGTALRASGSFGLSHGLHLSPDSLASPFQMERGGENNFSADGAAASRPPSFIKKETAPARGQAEAASWGFMCRGNLDTIP